MRRLSRRVLLGAAAGAIVGGCLSPTLPLPPPAIPDVQAIGQGEYRLTGTIPLPATVLVLNTRTNLVYGQQTDLAYDFLVEAKTCDYMLIWYETGSDQSTTVPFTIGSVVPDQCSLPEEAGADAARKSDGAVESRDGGSGDAGH